MMPEDYLRQYAEPMQSLAGAAPPADWQALLFELDCYYPPYLELGSGLDGLNRTDLLEILCQILGTEYPQRRLSRNTVSEFLEALRRLKEERSWRQAEMERLNAELAWRVEEMANLGAERKRLEILVSDSHAELENCRSQIAVLENECATLRSTLADLRESTSWKVTRPLRWFGRVVKATRAPDAA